MNDQLKDRLAAYRTALETAIDADLRRNEPAGGFGRFRRWSGAWLAGAAVAACVVALWAMNVDPSPDGGPVATTPPTPASFSSVVTTVAIEPPPTSLTPALELAPTTAATSSIPPPGPVLAIGDNVMLGAVDELSALGVLVDSVVGRTMSNAVALVEALGDLDPAVSTVVIHLGTNGPIGDETIERFFTALSEMPKVVVLTAHADRDWIPVVNEQLRQVPARFSNVELVDWDLLAEQCPGDCFYDDGIHLAQDGQEFYAHLIAEALAE